MRPLKCPRATFQDPAAENLDGWNVQLPRSHERHGSLLHQLQENLHNYQAGKKKQTKDNPSSQNLKLPFITLNPSINHYSKRKPCISSKQNEFEPYKHPVVRLKTYLFKEPDSLEENTQLLKCRSKVLKKGENRERRRKHSMRPIQKGAVYEEFSDAKFFQLPISKLHSKSVKLCIIRE